MPLSDALDPLGIYTSADVARLVHKKSLSWFYQNRSDLQTNERFPLPVSPNGHPRWNGTDLIAWLQRPKAISGKPGGNVVDYSARLAARAEALAHTASARRRGTP